MGKLGSFVDGFSANRLAGEIDADLSDIYRWVRRDGQPSVRRAIQIVEVAKAAGVNLSLEDVYESECTRVRIRMRAHPHR